MSARSVRPPKVRRDEPGLYHLDDIVIFRVRLWDGWQWIVRGPLDDFGQPEWVSDPHRTLAEAKAGAAASWTARREAVATR